MQRLLTIALAMLLATPSLAADWPEFRGPDGQGHAAGDRLPLEWAEDKNIVWKTPVAGLGWSSPVIRGNRIWLTTATEEGKSLRAVCIARETGEVMHDIEVFRQETPKAIHSKNSHASPTPILDGERVYVHFGVNGTACLTTAGEVLWRNDELAYQHGHGSGGSPVLYRDLLIMSCDGTDVKFVVALDKNTGKIRWKKERAGRMAYSTPLVIEVGGVAQVVSSGGDRVVAYDPHSGGELWFSRYDGYSVVPRPVFGMGLVFVCSGYDNPVVYAIRPDGTGDVTDTHVAWTLRRGAPHDPSPLLLGAELYVVTNDGVAACLDAATGKEHWRQRLGGGFSASPTAAGDRIYLLDEEGLMTVLAAGTKFDKLAANQLDGRTLASPAMVDGAIYLRTDTHLYRIEE